VLYMVVEIFRGGRPEAVYERARKEGRLTPPGLQYVAQLGDSRRHDVLSSHGV
jgi:hypothetical protein